MKILLKLITAITIFTTSAIGAEWRYKPVLCGPEEDVKDMILANEEYAIIGGIGQTAPHGDNPDYVVPSPVYWFINSKTGAFTIVEFHVLQREACVLMIGNGVDFNVSDLFVREETL